jgi:hypothetical protein
MDQVILVIEASSSDSLIHGEILVLLCRAIVISLQKVGMNHSKAFSTLCDRFAGCMGYECQKKTKKCEQVPDSEFRIFISTLLH